VQVGGDGAPGSAKNWNAGCTVVRAQPAWACEEGCCDVVGDANHHLMASARQTMRTHTDRSVSIQQQVSWQGSKQLAAESGQQ
jgi:hypothetical protein